MAPQHVEIAETIAALKKALRREKEAPSDQQISSATNRGNKLKRGASYVHAGSLPYSRGPEGYKQKIEHAGYTRYILHRNPRRYNEYGLEVDESESEADAEAEADEENPYAAIRLEELLKPLQHPADLATHPTLAQPFLDSALADMVRATDDKLRQERVNLWHAKSLNRQFMGDEPWMPCGNAETGDDWDLFEPKPPPQATSARQKSQSEPDPETHAERPNGQGPAAAAATARETDADDEAANITDPTTAETDAPRRSEPVADNRVERDAGGDSATTDKSKMADVDETMARSEAPQPDAQGTSRQENAENPDEDAEQVAVDEDDTQLQPTRRITRALAAEQVDPAAAGSASAPSSPASSIHSSLLHPDPLFLMPTSPASDPRAPRNLARLGMPADEFLETRRLLTTFIQKQEESVRGYEAVLGKLIKAKRMRDQVWEWCKAEGHVGEWSDGEDWIDAEAWGLGPDELKKGKDEEEPEGQEETGRKGKRRRRD